MTGGGRGHCTDDEGQNENDEKIEAKHLEILMY